MAGVNRVFFIGNLVADPRRQEYQGGTVKTTFKLAMNRPKGQNGEDRGADFVWVKTWGKQAEACAANLTKGSEVHIEGELNSYRKTNEDGTFSESIDVNARNVTFLRRPNGNGAPDSSAVEEAPSEEPVVATPADDDIPF